MLPSSTYEEAVEALNEKCTAGADTDPAFDYRVTWEVDDVRLHRWYCYRNKLGSNKVCDNCERSTCQLKALESEIMIRHDLNSIIIGNNLRSRNLLINVK